MSDLDGDIQRQNRLCILCLPAVASFYDAGRQVVLDEVGPDDAGRGSRQLAWSDGLGWVGCRQMTWVTYRERVDRTRPSYYTYSSHFFIKVQRNSLGIWENKLTDFFLRVSREVDTTQIRCESIRGQVVS